jgi:multiple sugar transport system substrate-binding protein
MCRMAAVDRSATTSIRGVTRRSFVKGAAVGAAASTVFAVPTIAAQEKGKVTFWTTHSGIGFDGLVQVTNDFNAQSTTSEVEIVQRPPADVSDSSSLITAIRGGVGPDVYLLDRFIVAERAAQGLLHDLTPMMEAAGDNPDLTDRYVGFSVAEATWDNKPFALPFDTDVRALFYNADLLKAKGVDLAPFDRANGPMTFDVFAEAIRAVDTATGNTWETLGFIPYMDQGGSPYTWGFAFGGDFFDYQGCQVTPDHPRVIEGLQWCLNYIEAQGVEKTIAYLDLIDSLAAPSSSPFFQGRLGATITGNWQFALAANYMPGANLGYTWIPVPAEGDPSYTWAGGWSSVIPQGARNVEGGYEFMRYLCGPEGSRTFFGIRNNLPVLHELLADRSLFSDDLWWFVQNIFPGTRYRPPLPVGARYWDELQGGFETIFLGLSDVAPAMAQVKSNTMAELKAGGYCPITAPPSTEAAP